MKNKEIRKILKTIIENEPLSIKAFVADEALEREDIQSFFFDLQQHGCISGMISPLIYYTDTHQFFDNFYDEIEELREKTEDNLGESIKITGDLKNTLAWFAFEETTYQMFIELNII